MTLPIGLVQIQHESADMLHALPSFALARHT